MAARVECATPSALANVREADPQPRRGAPLRQWVLTMPFAWRKRLGYDGPLLSALTRLFVKTVLDFHLLCLDGVYVEDGDTLRFEPAPAPTRAEPSSRRCWSASTHAS